MTTTTTTPTKTLTAKALDAELGRRRNNAKRAANGEPKVKAKGFVLPSLSKAQMALIKNGEVVTLTFKSGRTETVGLS